MSLRSATDSESGFCTATGAGEAEAAARARPISPPSCIGIELSAGKTAKRTVFSASSAEVSIALAEESAGCSALRQTKLQKAANTLDRFFDARVLAAIVLQCFRAGLGLCDSCTAAQIQN
jgi:hypothetical protein